MEWLLCVSDHIVELTQCLQTFPDGTKLEIMTSRPRSDLYVNLPALRKLDNMLLVRYIKLFFLVINVLRGHHFYAVNCFLQEMLDSFVYTEFWYVDQAITTSEDGGSSSFRKLLPRQEEKWWLPVPRVPVSGLSDDTRKSLQHRRDSTSKILKAAMAINSITLADMKVPDAYLEALPKNAKSNFGDTVYQYINSDFFSPKCLLECLDLSSEHQALELANKVEIAIYVWRRKNNSKSLNTTNKSGSKSSWGIIKDFVSDTDKRELLADRAESLLMSLKLQFPGLSQTSLDTSKIQYDKAIKAVLGSPLNKSGQLKALYVKTEQDVLIDIKPHARIPADYDSFADLMVQLLQRSSIKADGMREKVLKIVEGPVTRFLPANSVKIALSHSHGYEKRVNVQRHVARISSEKPLVFVVGAMAHGTIDVDYADEFIFIDKHPDSASICIKKICEALHRK